MPETVPASSAARAHVDGAEREDEAPGTAGAGPGRLHGAGTELAVAGQQLQAGGLRPTPGQSGALHWYMIEMKPMRVEYLYDLDQ